MGARPLRRAIQRYIEDPLADFVLGSNLEPGVTIVVDRKSESDEEVSITLAGGGRKREKVTVPAEPEDTPEDEPAGEPAE
jgi:ATP-dependent Clp protease ATP-binding subunit ClpC